MFSRASRKNIAISYSSHEALYLSKHGEVFFYLCIYGRDKSMISFESWLYYLKGKHIKKCGKQIKGFLDKK